MFKKLFNKKIIITFIVTLLITGLTLTIILVKDKIPLLRQSTTDWAFDVYDKAKVAGVSHYIFIGEVINEVETLYDEKGRGAYTIYDVRVIENIKGELVLDVVRLRKSGGLSKDKNYYDILEDDFLPKRGDICMFYTKATREDELFIPDGPNGNNLIYSAKDPAKSISFEVYSKTTEYVEAVKAYENEEYPYDYPKEERVSKYDVDYAAKKAAIEKNQLTY